jgi:hypothetical protein
MSKILMSGLNFTANNSVGIVITMYSTVHAVVDD